jgi:hypothetical protein
MLPYVLLLVVLLQYGITVNARNVSRMLPSAKVTYSSPYCSCASPDPVPLRNGAATLTNTSSIPATLKAKHTQTCSSLPVVSAGKECDTAIGICSPVSWWLGSVGDSCEGQFSKLLLGSNSAQAFSLQFQADPANQQTMPCCDSTQ